MIHFTKMHGLGNDFMVIDATLRPIALSPETIRRWADRHYGVGFDQLLVVEAAASGNAHFKYRVFNADGGEVFQCGNGARCFARFVRDKRLTDLQEIVVDTGAGQLVLRIDDDGLVTVNMGVPRHDPADIPLLAGQEAKFYSLIVNQSEKAFGAVSLGNPHAVFLVNDIKAAPVATLGAELERHPMFPERANIGFMQVMDRGHIRLRVFERGAGETLACGSGACAAVVVGIEQHLLDHQVRVELPGGPLTVRWPGRGQPVLMTGPAASVFEGRIQTGGECPPASAEEVERYLRQHPDFFHSHLALLEQLSIPHPSGNAVSLISKQLELVRSRHQDMQDQLSELIEIAQENDQLCHRMHKLTLALLDAGSLEALRANLEAVLKAQFQTDFVALRVIAPPPADGQADVFVGPDDPSLPPFRQQLLANQPVCGPLTPAQARAVFGGDALAAKSAAIVPMVFAELEGLLVIGSRDGHKFHPQMGTLFLAQMGELVATRLVSLLHRR